MPLPYSLEIASWGKPTATGCHFSLHFSLHASQPTLPPTSCRQLQSAMLRSCAALQAPPTARRSGPEAAVNSAFCATTRSACPTVEATSSASRAEPAGVGVG